MEVLSGNQDDDDDDDVEPVVVILWNIVEYLWLVSDGQTHTHPDR